MSSFPYSEPAFHTLLSVSGFVLSLNVAGSLLDQLCYVGLLGQVILGALWGTPLGGLLPAEAEATYQLLGYISLLLLVAEGGTEVRLEILADRKIFALAVLVGLTGSALPIGVSLLLLPFAFGFTLLQSFACGAALSATSMGTILSLLASVKQSSVKTASVVGSADLLNTRLGTILVGAALLDDIVALVLSKIVQVLGPSSETLGAWDIARPILSSALMVAVVAALSRWALKPLAAQLARSWTGVRTGMPSALRKVSDFAFSSTGSAIVGYIAVLMVFVTIAHYIGTSPLLGVFCAGALMKYTFDAFEEAVSTTEDTSRIKVHSYSPQTVTAILEPLQKRFLLPLFFASIGFAIPLGSLFEGRVVWQGFVFGGLMLVAKALAGAWPALFGYIEELTAKTCALHERAHQTSTSAASERRERELEITELREIAGLESSLSERGLLSPTIATTQRKAIWWAPSLLLGLSLIARGEIGFLIIGLARESGLVGVSIASADQATSNAAERSYLVAIWALIINTLAGPVLVGIMVKWRDQRMVVEIGRGRWGAVAAR